MAAPSIHLLFKKIFGPIGSYVPVWEDRSRAGIDGHRFYFMGKRGERQQVRTLSFFATEVNARAAVGIWLAACGREVTIGSELDNASYQVFLHRVTADLPRAVGCTIPNANFKVETVLDIQRTA